jgi:hypothetical protein
MRKNFDLQVVLVGDTVCWVALSQRTFIGNILVSNVIMHAACMHYFVSFRFLSVVYKVHGPCNIPPPTRPSEGKYVLKSPAHWCTCIVENVH